MGQSLGARANHSSTEFFNSTGPRYNPTAARQAYADVLAWLETYVD